jgi:hypothetical protein
MAFNFKKILAGNKADSADIEREFESLKTELSEKIKLKAELEEKLVITDQDILAGTAKVDSLEPIQRELERTNLRIRTIQGVLSNLNDKLYSTKKEETRVEIVTLEKQISDKQATKPAIKKKMAHHLAMAGILYRDLTGDDPENVSVDFFLGKSPLMRNEDDLAMYRAALNKNGVDAESLHSQINSLKAHVDRCKSRLERLDKDFGKVPAVPPVDKKPTGFRDSVDLNYLKSQANRKPPAHEFSSQYEDGICREGMKKPAPYKEAVELSGKHAEPVNGGDPAGLFAGE